MDWKPLTFTEEEMKENLRRLRTVPDEIIEVFKNRENDLKKAEREVDQFLEREPKNVAANMYKAMILNDQRRYKEALPYTRFLTKQIPLIPKAWELRGMAELMHRNTEIARIAFMHAGHFSREKAWPYCCIAMTYFLEREHNAALFFLDEVIREGKVKDTSALLYTRAIIEEKAGDIESAFTHFIELQMLDSDVFTKQASVKLHALASRKNESDGELEKGA